MSSGLVARLKVPAFAGSALLLSLFATDAGALTQTVNTYGGWTVRCVQNGGKSACAMSQQLFAPRTRKPVAAWSVALNNKQQTVHQIALPSGVNLTAGVELALGSKRVRVPYSACTPRGCTAVFLMNDTVEKALSAEGAIPVYFVGANAKKFQLRFSAKGFPAAYAALRNEPVPKTTAATSTQTPNP